VDARAAVRAVVRVRLPPTVCLYCKFRTPAK
jgi:hypothetical protein